MKLYHYTSLLHVKPIIEYGGLWKGDIPLTSDVSRYGKEGHAVWFTTCDYANPHEHGLRTPGIDKSEIRFTADLDPNDPRLFKWSEYARLNKVEENWFKVLDDGFADTWWLFISPISLHDLAVSRKVDGVYLDVDVNEIKRSPHEENVMLCDIGVLF